MHATQTEPDDDFFVETLKVISVRYIDGRAEDVLQNSRSTRELRGQKLDF